MRTIVFRTYLNVESRDDYYKTAGELFNSATGIPGFVAAKTFTATDGEELTVVEFASDEALNEWRAHTAHLEAQKSSGRFFGDYRISVFGDAIRDYGIHQKRPFRK